MCMNCRSESGNYSASKDRSLRQLLQGIAFHVGAAEGCDLLGHHHFIELSQKTE
jgi:hypothetical protein